MVKKGDKIILVKEMTYFKNVGEVCEVVEVIDDGAVVFTFGNNGVCMGAVDMNSFEKHFEVYEEPEEEVVVEAISVDPDYIKYLMDNSDITVDTKFDKCTVVTAKLPNGFVISEFATCVDPLNYDKAIAYDICIEKIKEKVWELESYRLQCDIYESMSDEGCGLDCYLNDECENCGMCE